MKQGRRRLIRRIATVSGVMLAGVLFVWLVVLGLGIAVPLDGFRDPIEAAASRALGREVHIDGPLTLRPTPSPTLVAHDVRIAGPAGQSDLLRAARCVVRLAPGALLQGEVRSVRLLIEDAAIELDTRGAVAHRPDSAVPEAANAGVSSRLLSASATLLAEQPDLQQLVLRRAVLNYRDDRSGPFPVKLDEFSAQFRPEQPLELMLRSRFQQQPYTIDVTGGQLADLLTPTWPWPVRAGISIADTRLVLNGYLEASAQGLVMTHDLQIDWPAEFAQFAARFGAGPLAGRLTLHADSGRPVVAGELQLPDAVLRYGAGAGPARDDADQSNRAAEVPADGSVSVPLTVSIADVPFHGQLIVAGQVTEPVVELALSATAVNADGMLTTLTGITGIRGRIQRIGIQASARTSGETAMVNRAGLALQVDGASLSYGNAAGERPVAVTLDELALTLPAGEEVQLRARGSLRDEPFAVELTGGGLGALLTEDTWPITLSATGGGAALDISGPLAVARGDTPTRLHVGLYGKRLGDLAAWLGVSPCASSAYTLRGELVLAEDIGRLQFLQVRTDTTQLDGELDWSGDDQIALLHAVLHFETLDPEDIEALIPLVNGDSGEGTGGGVAIDLPVLPGRIEIINADIDLNISRILLKLVDITEVSLAARIREGVLQRSPFHAQIGTAGFKGYLDPATAETGVVFEDESDESAAGGRMDRLFSGAVRWVGRNAVVPIRWMFSKKLSAGDSADCEAPGAEAGE